MKVTPAILGAIGAAVLGGAALGATTNTNPLARDGRTLADAIGEVPQHRLSFTESALNDRPQQDQYALETHRGTVEVGHLQDYGLGRNRGRDVDAIFREDEAQYAFYDPALPSEDLGAPSMRSEPVREDILARQPAATPERAAVAAQRVAQIVVEEVQQAPAHNPPARLSVLSSDGQSRVIDVAAELAAQ